MNTKMRTTLMVAAGLCLLLTALAALAAGGDGLRPGPAGGPQSLTPEQRKAVLDIRQKHEKALFDLHQKLARAGSSCTRPGRGEARREAHQGPVRGHRQARGRGRREARAQRLELRANGLPERPASAATTGIPAPRPVPRLGAGPDAAPGLLAAWTPARSGVRTRTKISPALPPVGSGQGAGSFRSPRPVFFIPRVAPAARALSVLLSRTSPKPSPFRFPSAAGPGTGALSALFRAQRPRIAAARRQI
jgi:hypothetical protein